MKTTNMPFDETGSDFNDMWLLLKEIYKRDQEKSPWVFARLEDWYYNLCSELRKIPTYHRKNAHLWRDNEGTLVGFAICEDGKDDFYVYVRPGNEELYDDLVSWVVDNWFTKNDSLFTTVMEDQTLIQEVLKRHGFINAGVDEITRKYDLKANGVQKIELPAGYMVVGMDDCDDWTAKKYLYNKGFGDGNEVSDVDIEVMEYWKSTPSFNPRYHLSVVDEEGNHLSTCYGFADPENKMAEIEKVCTHPDCRRKGFATAAIRECFNRLLEDGYEYAYITGSSDAAKATYKNVAPHEDHNVLKFVKK